MATIHTGTTLVPSKLELLAAWLPRQPWYRNTGRPPAPARAGGFRLDDPAGDVGIEFAFVTDGTGSEATTYHVPMAYRGAPLAGAEEGLIGTSEHGVLGLRWIYDAAHDPVAVGVLLDFLCAGTVAQHQSRSDTSDPSVARRWTAPDALIAPVPLRVSDAEPGRTVVAVELPDPSAGTVQHALHLVRVLAPGAAGDDGVLGSVEADWTLPDGTSARGPVVVVR